MIILEQPYISKFLEETLVHMQVPVLKNRVVKGLPGRGNLNLVEEEEFIRRVRRQRQPLIYSNSENALPWVINNLGFTELPKTIQLFKNKVAFRRHMETLTPWFFYKETRQPEEIEVASLRKPFIIKPALGFSSVGVHKVSTDEEWNNMVILLKKEMQEAQGIYPEGVISATQFIIEDYVEGEELAVDVYYDGEGKAVILNIFKHLFSSERDVSDRVYITSKDIIESYHDLLSTFLNRIGGIIDLRHFPMHGEFRIDSSQRIVPIEINPLRFCGWCTTDIAFYAYGLNVYDYYFHQKKPDWQELLKGQEGNIYTLAIGHVPMEINRSEVEGIDYERFTSLFQHVLEMRKVNYREFPIFAFLFARTCQDNFEEIERFLKTDDREYLIGKGTMNPPSGKPFGS